MTGNKDRELHSSTQDDWKSYYAKRSENPVFQLVDIDDFRNLPHRIIVEKIKKYWNGGRILEVGAGDSSFIIDLQIRLKPDGSAGLDYLPEGCELLEKKAASAGVKVNVICADMFSPPVDIKKKFDFVISCGVVEHFFDLPEVVRAISEFSAPGGIVFTLIPNNKGTVYGWLMKKWNLDVYNAHVLYDHHDLIEAHRLAGLDILSCEYIASSHFGVLSWCFQGRESGPAYWIFKQLTRVSKIVWLLESKFGKSFSSRIFSPYIICVGRRVQ